ncbi:MAG TPA: hypothetical protein PKY59_20895 [Pyrinomonadaceae bacterium]|nr:hypothetical protein [Pyrinomonadaceae bacterium]
MNFKTTLQLIQGRAGYLPGSKDWLVNEKWVVIKFQSAYIGPNGSSPYDGLYDFLGNMSEMPLMGRYSIITTDQGKHSSYVIGNHAAPENKVWQFNPKLNIIQLSTLSLMTGTPETGNQMTTRLDRDVELHHAYLTSKGFTVGGGGWYGYGQGIVFKKSWSNLPFEDRPFYWTSYN